MVFATVVMLRTLFVLLFSNSLLSDFFATNFLTKQWPDQVQKRLRGAEKVLFASLSSSSVHASIIFVVRAARKLCLNLACRRM